MDGPPLSPEIDTTLDRLRVDTESESVLLITPTGELAAYSGPGDRATASAIFQLLGMFTRSSDQIVIQRILHEARIGGDLYLSPLPHGWKLLLIDHAAAARIGKIMPLVQLASSEVAENLPEDQSSLLMTSVEMSEARVYGQPLGRLTDPGK